MPTATPVAERWAERRWISLATPKSSSLTLPSSQTKTLAGLMSRWITPTSWAAFTAAAMGRSRAIAASGLSLPSRAKSASRGSPISRSMT